MDNKFSVEGEKTMYEYDEECLQYFLENQLQLFPEEVAETEEEAAYFLEDCMAVICNTPEEVMDYFDEVADISGMTIEELLQEPEVFVLPSGRYLIVEG